MILSLIHILSAMATYVDCIKNGVTTVFDHHASFGSIGGSLFEIERAAKETGVRSCLCYEISDRDGMDKAREAVMENAEFIRHALKDESGMIAGMMGMHAQFTISDETFALAAENKPEGEMCIRDRCNLVKFSFLFILLE